MSKMMNLDTWNKPFHQKTNKERSLNQVNLVLQNNHYNRQLLLLSQVHQNHHPANQEQEKQAEEVMRMERKFLRKSSIMKKLKFMMMEKEIQNKLKERFWKLLIMIWKMKEQMLNQPSLKLVMHQLNLHRHLHNQLHKHPLKFQLKHPKLMHQNQ